MTKRALIVIALIILIPIVFVLVAFGNFKDANRVVAQYSGNIDIIEYDGLTLHRVNGEFEYIFKFGEYLGKVNDAFTGAPLYRVADDSTGRYYAIAEGNRRVLYTETGKLIDGIKTENSTVTRLIFDNYLLEETDPDDLALFTGFSGKKVSVDMSSYKQFKYYDLYVAFDGSAIITEYFGRLIYLTEREDWIFILPEDREAAEEEYGDEIEENVYIAELINDTMLKDLLDSYFEEHESEENMGSEG